MNQRARVSFAVVAVLVMVFSTFFGMTYFAKQKNESQTETQRIEAIVAEIEADISAQAYYITNYVLKEAMDNLYNLEEINIRVNEEFNSYAHGYYNPRVFE
ncbi:MAG: hypothetical protein AB1779_01005, partial [Candidatus Thermoplasmatota archaeon]